MTHSRSRVVLETLINASKANKRFHVFVTKSFPDNDGEKMCKELEDAGIECTLILDSAIGYVMENVDLVLCGAEGVVESGGIINRVGTFTMALCSREMKKPFYVLTESFKFSRLYPLNQRDIPNDFKVHNIFQYILSIIDCFIILIFSIQESSYLGTIPKITL